MRIWEFNLSKTWQIHFWDRLCKLYCDFTFKAIIMQQLHFPNRLCKQHCVYAIFLIKTQQLKDRLNALKEQKVYLSEQLKAIMKRTMIYQYQVQYLIQCLIDFPKILWASKLIMSQILKLRGKKSKISKLHCWIILQLILIK